MSSEVFAALDDHTWKLTWKWATFTHSKKPKAWVITQYFDAFNKSRRAQWVFGDRQSGTYLQKFAWTKIVRHQIVTGTASPDDPTLVDYWAARRRKAPPPPIDNTSLRLFEAQHGRCSLCGAILLAADDPPQTPREWEQWLTTTRKAIVQVAIRVDGTSDKTQPRLIHAHCHPRLTDDNGPALLSARGPSGLA